MSAARRCWSAAMVQKNRQYRGGYRFVDLLNDARTMRNQETAAEELLWNLLRRRQLLGFKFRRQHQFGKYIADFYCHEAKLIIECDGSSHDTDERWHHDQNRDGYMIAQGLRVLRFTNQQFKSHGRGFGRDFEILTF